MRPVTLIAVVVACLFGMTACAKKGEEEKKGAPAGEVKRVEAEKPAEPKPEPKPGPKPDAEKTPKVEAATEAPKPVEPAPAPEQTPAEKAAAVLDEALAAMGGLDALKAKTSAYVVKSKGAYFGDRYEMTTMWKAPDKLLMDINSGEMRMGYSGSECWVTFNEVVIDCPASEKQYAAETLWAFYLQNLYTLKDEGIVLAQKGEAELDGKKVDLVEATKDGAPMPVTFAFDKATGLMARMEYDGHMMGRAGKASTRIAAYGDYEGLKLCSQSAMLFDERLVVADEVVSVAFGNVDDGAFARPAQAQTGVTKVRHVRSHTVVSTVHRGPYDRIGSVVGKTFGWIATNSLVPFGAPTMIYLKDPTNAKTPDDYETELQFPIAPVPDASKLQGDGLAVKVLPDQDIAVAVEIGPFDKVGAAYGDLASWAAQNGYEVVGPAGMTTFSDPMSAAPDQLVHEIFFPVKAKGVAPAAPAEGVAPAAPAEGVAPAAPAEGVAPAAPAEGVAPAAPAEGSVPAAPAEGSVPAAPAAPAVE